MKLVGQFHQVGVIAISMFTVVVATLAVNIAANVVSPANDFANAFPKLISFRTGGLITGIIGILMQPWRLLADPSGYIFSWLVGYSGGLGSIAGVLILDYWLLRRKNLALGDLYRVNGEYSYDRSQSRIAQALVIIGFVLIGIVVGWYVSFGRAIAVLHWLLPNAPEDVLVTPFLLLRINLALLVSFIGWRIAVARGWNSRAIAATLVGCFFAWIGVFVPRLRPLYDYGWFMGFGVAAGTYFLLMVLSPPQITPTLETKTT
jgi:cytosine/uracil/thiamine/allantoin permease